MGTPEPPSPAAHSEATEAPSAGGPEYLQGLGALDSPRQSVEEPDEQGAGQPGDAPVLVASMFMVAVAVRDCARGWLPLGLLAGGAACMCRSPCIPRLSPPPSLTLYCYSALLPPCR
jgi:hypothetical protein